MNIAVRGIIVSNGELLAFPKIAKELIEKGADGVKCGYSRTYTRTHLKNNYKQHV